MDSVTDIRHEDEVAPQDVDLPSSVPGQIWNSVEKLYKTRTMPAISLALRHKGELILHRSIGHASGNGPADTADTPKTIMRADTPVCLFSASKAITGMLVHKLAEEGLVKLHAPVAEYIPEFAAKGKQYITLSQVLAHRGGFPTIKQKEPDPSLLWDWDQCIKTLCESTPRKDAGKAQAYHAITGGFILGEIIRRVTGQELNDVLRSRVSAPLGSQSLSYGLPADKQSDAALNYFTGQAERFPIKQFAQRALGASFEMVTEVSNSPEFMSAVIPAGNMYGSALDVCDFYQCLLNGGHFGKERLFERATVTRAISEANSRQFDRTLLLPIRTSEGFMLGDHPIGMYGPRTSQAFGHLGFISIFSWADPERDISCALLTTGKPILSTHYGALWQVLSGINSSFSRY
ncbi:MAG: serine hydrolase domain-containing protein [Oceanococcus sp.]